MALEVGVRDALGKWWDAGDPIRKRWEAGEGLGGWERQAKVFGRRGCIVGTVCESGGKAGMYCARG